MNLQRLTTTALITTISLSTCESVAAQDPPAETFQPGYWQPRARLDISRPIEIAFVNQTELMMEYSLTTNEAPPRQLLPGDTAVLKEIPVPAYVLINPKTPLKSVKYETKVADNVVTVTIKQISDALPGDTTLNIDPEGAVYIY